MLMQWGKVLIGRGESRCIVSEPIQSQDICVRAQVLAVPNATRWHSARVLARDNYFGSHRITGSGWVLYPRYVGDGRALSGLENVTVGFFTLPTYVCIVQNGLAMLGAITGITNVEF